MAKKNPINVRVRVTANVRLSFDEILTFTKEEWEEFKTKEPKDAGESLADRLDYRNAQSDDLDDFEAEVVDDAGKAIKPLDRYTQD